ncbi:MAG: neutral/alkaline non-lysosomal ceramidase N-terminal domain-containing protein, partial [Oscillospiraceae bacterium]|nr:neutral/alkaline non-lysosomal ceramidase N-terminal domain-containing protein [Oscillospiraceae bacterium]
MAKQINGYGVALSLENMPGADFDQAEDERYTVYDKAAFNALYADNQVATNSCVLTGILKTGNDQTENTANADSRVYANLYLRLGDSILLSDEKNAGKTVEDEGFDGIACSMLQLVNSIHKNWSKYSSANRMTLRSFVGNWKPYVEENTFPVLQNEIQVGFGRVDIVPTMSVPLAGYGQTHKRMSTGVQDRIYATCVAITEASGKTLLLISQDLIDSSWYLDAAAAIEAATGIPQEQIMISGTHTHAAPDIRSTLDCIKEYKAEYLAHMVAVAEQALADRSDALAYAGAAILEKMNSVRHYLMADGTYAGDNFGSFTNNTIVEPAEQADKELQVIRFVREGKAAISMMNWQAHVTFGTSSSSTLISSCFVGTARDHFEKTTGDLFIYFTGACGNVNARSKISGQNTGSNYREYGEVLSQTAINIIAGMEAESFITDFGTKKLTVTGQIDHSMEDKLEEAREVTAVYNAQGLSAGNKLAKQYGFSSAYHAQAVVRRSSYELTRDMDLYAFCLGDIAFIAAPYEMFAAHGL